LSFYSLIPLESGCDSHEGGKKRKKRVKRKKSINEKRGKREKEGRGRRVIFSSGKGGRNGRNAIGRILAPLLHILLLPN